MTVPLLVTNKEASPVCTHYDVHSKVEVLSYSKNEDGSLFANRRNTPGKLEVTLEAGDTFTITAPLTYAFDVGVNLWSDAPFEVRAENHQYITKYRSDEDHDKWHGTTADAVHLGGYEFYNEHLEVIQSSEPISMYVSLHEPMDIQESIFATTDVEICR